MFSGVGTPRSLLTGFYSYPGEYASGINQVFSITENGFSILATILLVGIIMYAFLNFNEYNK